MCVEEMEDAERLDFGEAGVEKPDEFSLPHMESVCENTTAADFNQNKFGNFIPIIRSGDWSDIGSRQYMEDTYVCIADLAKHFGYPSADTEAISFYGPSADTYHMFFIALLSRGGGDTMVHYMCMDTISALFRQMLKEGVMPNTQSLNVLVKSYAQGRTQK